MSQTADLRFAGMSRAAIIRAGLVVLFIAGGYVGTTLLEKTLRITLEKPAMPLTKPLPSLPQRLGTPAIRYSADEPDRNMAPDVVAVLGTKDYLLRKYKDLTKPAGEAGDTVSLNLNYYSQGDATPHVPEICWAGSGLTTEKSYPFEVKGVKLRNGSTVNIPMRMIVFQPRSDSSVAYQLASPDDAKKYLKNVAYTFNVNGEYVATTKGVISTFWKADYKYAYYSKIEVTVDRLCDPQDAERIVGDFIRASAAHIEECLPDPSLLREDSAATSPPSNDPNPPHSPG